MAEPMKVKEVKEHTQDGQNGWQITWENNKTDFTQDRGFYDICLTAKQGGLLVTRAYKKVGEGFKLVDVRLPLSTREKSPESKPTNREDSIETQVAFKGVVELLVANIITKDDALGKGAFQWAANKLGVKLDAPEPRKEVVKVPGSPDVSKTETSHLDLDWVKEQIGILQGKGLKAWTNASILSYLKTVCKVEAKTPSEAIKQLSEAQGKEFKERIEDAIEVS